MDSKIRVLAIAALVSIISIKLYAQSGAEQSGGQTACEQWIESIPVSDGEKNRASRTCVRELIDITERKRRQLLDAYIISDGQFIEPSALNPLASQLPGASRLKVKAIESQYFRRDDVSIDPETMRRLAVEASDRDDTASLTALNFALSTAALMSGDFDGMTNLAGDALTGAERLSAKRMKPKILNSLGVSHTISGEYDLAVDYYEKAIAAAQTVGDFYRIATVTANIGNIFSDLGDRASAIKYYEAALEASKTSGRDDLYLEAGLLGNIATAYTEDERHEEALPYYEAAKEIAAKSPRRDLDGLLNANHARSMHIAADEAQAIEMAEISVQQTLDHRDPAEAASILNWLAERYIETGAISSAQEKLDQAREIMQPGDADPESLVDASGSLFFRLNYAKNMAAIMGAIGEREEALSYSNVALTLSDKRFTQEKIDAAVNSDLLFDLRARDRDVELLQQRNIVQDLRLRQSRLRAVLGLIIGGLAIATALFLFRSYRLQKTLADAKDTFLLETHHRTKNNLQILSSMLSLSAQRDKKNKTENSTTIDAANRARAMALIHHHVYERHDSVAIDVDARSFLEELVSLLKKSLGRDDVRIQTDIEPSRLDVDAATPLGLIVCELVTNAFKHAFQDRGGELTVSLTQEPDGLTLIVKDDGPGFNLNAAKDQATSLGVQLVEDLSSQIGASVSSDSGPEGSAWRISKIPAGPTHRLHGAALKADESAAPV
ncbi:MAG: tetratricopeptide repeat protein [Pseudomonadota bacterium]